MYLCLFVCLFSNYKDCYCFDFYVSVNNFSVMPYAFSMVPENKRILKYLSNLSANQAFGLDDLPSRFVRDSASVIVCPLMHVITVSFI